MADVAGRDAERRPGFGRQAQPSAGFEAGGKVMVGEPKTLRGRRPIALDPGTVQVLKAHRNAMLEERMKLGGAFVDEGLVFHRVDGRCLRPEGVSATFKRTVIRLGLAPLTVKGLRHTWATLALERGIHPRVVQERLGHSTIAITPRYLQPRSPDLARRSRRTRRRPHPVGKMFLGKYHQFRYNLSMKSSEALRVLAEMSASQWGMVTTAQAATHGVERLDLSRLAKAGHLERLAHGVYRDAGAPADEFEGLRAAWLAADPSRTAEARLRDLVSGIVVMGESAAALHGVGDLPADRHELSSPTRRQTQRSVISYRQRQLDPDDVTIAHGLPVTTIERTIADLVEARTDLSLVADVLRDAARVRNLDTDRLADLLSPLAARNGHRKDDGTALLDHLAALAGLDAASLAAEIGTSKTLSALVTANSLARFDTAGISKAIMGPAAERALQGLNESIAQSVAQSLAPALKAFAASIEMPPMPGMETALSVLAERVSLDLPTQDLLASFGRNWAAELTAMTATSRSKGLRTLPSSTAIEVAERAGIGA